MGAAGRADGVAPFPADTDFFGRPDQQTMLSFRVTDLDAMPAQLRAAGASVDDGICEASFGRCRTSRRPRRQPVPALGAVGDPADVVEGLGQTSGSYMISRTSCAQRQAAANLVAHSSATSREGTSTIAKPPMTSLTSGNGPSVTMPSVATMLAC